MKNSLLFFFLLFVGNVIAQTNDHILFDYDAAGNQIKRYLVDINPDGNKQSNQPVKDIKDITDSDLIKADIYDDLKYYPNPVKEQLYLKWNLLNGNTVKSITLYSLSGQLIKVVNNMENDNAYIFPFQELPQGIYSLILNCSNGEQKSLKIVKH